MPYETITLDVADGVATLTMNRPEKLNAQNARMGVEIHDVCGRIDELDVRAMVVTGNRKAFSAGADLSEGTSTEDMDEPTWIDTVNVLADVPIPTIAAIEGWCLGGGLLTAIACDLRIAGADAKLGAPEILRGIYFGSTGTWRMPRIIGPSRTKELFFFGDRIDAQTALQWGLLNRVVEPGGALVAATEMAKRLAAGATVAIRVIKKLVNEGTQVPLAEGLKMEGVGSREVLGSEDRNEGITAFLEKRDPVFRGR